MDKNTLQKFAPRFLIFFLILFIVIKGILSLTADPQKLTYSEFLKEVESGHVQTINIVEGNNTMDIVMKDKSTAVAPNPEYPTFKQDMYEKGVETIHSTKSINWTSFIFNLIFIAILIYFVKNTFSKKGGSPLNMKNNIKTNQSSVKDVPNVRNASFKDVAGIDEAKEELLEVVDFLKNPKKYGEMSIRMPKGVILYGPPGTGKTLLARATASEAGVPFMYIGGSEFVEMFVGVGARRVRQLFEEAKKQAPCVIFIDEFDSMGKARGKSGNSNDEREQTLNQILIELDGCGAAEGVIVMAATNRIDVLDPAILRPGRFDRHIEVSLPDKKGRIEILKVHSKDKPIDKNVDFEKIARQTRGFAGANLENLLNEAGMMAIRSNRKVINSKDIDDAFNRVVAGAKKKHNPISEKELRTVAYHEAGHALIARMVANQPVEKVTVSPTGNALGYVLHSPKENYLRTKKELFDEICISLGGRAAEIYLNGEDLVTTGASQDFKQATKVAYDMVTTFGMSDLGVISIHDNAEDMWLRLSDDIKNKAYEEVQNILHKAKDYTDKFIHDNKEILINIAEYLLENENLDSHTLDTLIFPVKIASATTEIPEN